MKIVTICIVLQTFTSAFIKFMHGKGLVDEIAKKYWLIFSDARTTKRTTFNWISKATCWAYIVWGLESIIVVRGNLTRLTS